jgi:ATP-dependent Clp protease ATP-binding subunit ClpC
MSRRRQNPGADEPIEDVEAAARTAATKIVRRYDTQWPEPETLAEDETFLEAGNRLADQSVPFDVLERLGRSSPVLAAMSHRAVSLRDDIPASWVDWAYGRMKQAYGGELRFLLQAVERHGEPPFLARVLARSDDDWSTGWLLQVITAFVERRVRAGEEPTAEEFDEFVARADIATVGATIEALRGTLPAESVKAFSDWKAAFEQREFFATFARVWEPPPDRAGALLSVAGRGAVVDALRAVIGAESPRSVLLVGEHGVGKSALLREALRPFHDEGWLVVEAGAPEVSAGQTFVGQLEGRVQEIAEHAATGRRVVWVLPEFEATLWAGQHSRSPRGLLDALLPYISAGRLVVVGEVVPGAYELVLRWRPRVASFFEVLRLTELTRDETIEVARDWATAAGAEIDDATLLDAQDLAEQYLASVASPTGLLRLLKATLANTAAESGGRIRTDQVLATLSEASGLPLHVLDPQAPLDLDEVRGFFASRVLGQAEAVDCIVDRIALIKANLTDPTRPLGVFLFVGPTGTGKTEIAKTLAEFLFGSPDRLVRLDMSEFQTSESLERLLADASTNDEAAPLIAAVRAKPFSVVLLDEFEKAHRNIWSLFLQVFDDGRLTDRRGKTADFRQCVVIATSNLGAAVESGRPLGFASDGGPRFHPAAVERALVRIFRPEFLNRIDRIVVFRPFEREQVRALLERELALVLDRRGFRGRPWAIEWDESALELLAEKGFSSELGARPLKRAFERYLLAPLAQAIVSRSFPEGEQFLFITARDDRIEVAFVDPDLPERAVVDTPQAATSIRLERLVLDPTGGPDERDFLSAETERLRAVIGGTHWSGRKELDLESMRGEAFWDSPERFAVLARIEYVDRVQTAFATAEKLADRLARIATNGRGSARELIELLAQRLYLLDRACADADAGDPADAFLEIRATGLDRAEGEFALQLRDMYEAWARRRGMRLRELWSDGSHLFAVSGIGAYRILADETGIHVLETPHDHGSFDRVAVRVTVAPRVSTGPDVDLLELARAALEVVPASGTIVRRYREKPSPLVRDAVRDWRTGRLDRVLAGDFDVILSE